MKVVLDTNVYISGIVFGGSTQRVLELVRAGEIEAYASTEILLELARKLSEKFDWQEGQIKILLRALSKVVKLVDPRQKLKVVKQDPTDNAIVECAVEAKADYIVSGDRHLLDLKELEGIRIITPRELLDMVG